MMIKTATSAAATRIPMVENASRRFEFEEAAFRGAAGPVDLAGLSGVGSGVAGVFEGLGGVSMSTFTIAHGVSAAQIR